MYKRCDIAPKELCEIMVDCDIEEAAEIVEVPPVDLLFHPLSLKQIARRVIVNYGLSTALANADVRNFILNDGNPIESSPFYTTDRYICGKPAVPETELQVPAFPVHPMDSLKPVLSLKFDLKTSALRYLEFVKEFSLNSNFQDEAYAEEACRRYELFVSLQQDHPKKILTPPADVRAVWLAVLIRPVNIRASAAFLKEVPPCHLLQADFASIAIGAAQTETLWKAKFKDEPFEHKEKPSLIGKVFAKKKKERTMQVSISGSILIQDLQWYSDLLAQSSPNKLTEQYIESLVGIYELFLYFHAKYPNTKLTPPVPVDLIWHTHMCYPQFYQADMDRITVRGLKSDSKKNFFKCLLHASQGDAKRMDHSPWPDGSGLVRSSADEPKFAAEFGGLSMPDLIKDPTRLPMEKVNRVMRLRPQKCTFRTTNRVHVLQNFYSCETCGLSNNLGCCEICVKQCHAGHKVALAKRTSCFCDCSLKTQICKC